MIELWDYDLDHELFARVGSRAFRQCQAFDHTRLYTGGVESVRCGGAAMRGVTFDRESNPDRHSRLLCDRHTLEYLGPMVRQ
jgi:hypothetical protein